MCLLSGNAYGLLGEQACRSPRPMPRRALTSAALGHQQLFPANRYRKGKGIAIPKMDTSKEKQNTVRALAAPLTILFSSSCGGAGRIYGRSCCVPFKRIFLGAHCLLRFNLASVWLLFVCAHLCRPRTIEITHKEAHLRYGVVPTDMRFTVCIDICGTVCRR